MRAASVEGKLPEPPYAIEHASVAGFGDGAEHPSSPHDPCPSSIGLSEGDEPPPVEAVAISLADVDKALTPVEGENGTSQVGPEGSSSSDAESDEEDEEWSPRPAKRQRRKLRAHVAGEVPEASFDPANPASQTLITSEDIFIQGVLQLKSFQSTIQYNLTFSQVRPHEANCSDCSRVYDGSGENKESLPRKTLSGKRSRPRGRPSTFSPKDDALLLSLVQGGGSWPEIAEKFPGRNSSSLQARYRNKLKV